MTHTLTAFMELMDHGIVSWENLSSVFIKKVPNLSLLLHFPHESSCSYLLSPTSCCFLIALLDRWLR